MRVDETSRARAEQGVAEQRGPDLTPRPPRLAGAQFGDHRVGVRVTSARQFAHVTLGGAVEVTLRRQVEVAFVGVRADQQVDVRPLSGRDGVGGLVLQHHAERAEPDERIESPGRAQVDAGELGAQVDQCSSDSAANAAAVGATPRTTPRPTGDPSCLFGIEGAGSAAALHDRPPEQRSLRRAWRAARRRGSPLPTARTG